MTASVSKTARSRGYQFRYFLPHRFFQSHRARSPADAFWASDRGVFAGGCPGAPKEVDSRLETNPVSTRPFSNRARTMSVRLPACVLLAFSSDSENGVPAESYSAFRVRELASAPPNSNSYWSARRGSFVSAGCCTQRIPRADADGMASGARSLESGLCALASAAVTRASAQINSRLISLRLRTCTRILSQEPTSHLV